MPQLLRYLVSDSVGCVSQPGKEIAEPGALPLQIRQLPGHIPVDVFPHQGMEFLLLHPGKAPQVQHIPGDIFQQVVEEGADLRRVKGRGSPGLCPQAILHKIGKVTRAHPLQPGGGHGGAFAVQRPHRSGGQRSPPQPGGPLHTCQPPGENRLLREVTPQRPAGNRCLQRRNRSCQTVVSPAPLLLYPQSRKQRPQAPCHKGGTKLRSGHVCHRIAHRQSLRGLRQGGVKILQLNTHTLHTGGSQLNAPLMEFIPVILIQDTSAPSWVRENMVIGSKEKQVLCRVPVVPGDLADRHLVQGYRNRTHAVLSHHLPKQPGKLIQFHRLAVQYLHKLVQHPTEDLP